MFLLGKKRLTLPSQEKKGKKKTERKKRKKEFARQQREREREKNRATSRGSADFYLRYSSAVFGSARITLFPTTVFNSIRLRVDHVRLFSLSPLPSCHNPVSHLLFQLTRYLFIYSPFIVFFFYYTCKVKQKCAAI